MRRTALVIRAPEADAVVGHWREGLASDARRGVPAHFTVLFPFVPVVDIDGARDRIAAALAPIAPFEYALTSTAWFGSDVLWLAPDDDVPFRTLIGSVERAFPALRPYGGAHAQTVPHLTIGDGRALADLQETERAIQARLPIHGRVERLTLLAEQSDATRRTSETFPLGRERL